MPSPPYLAAVHQWTTAAGDAAARFNDQVTSPPTLPWTRVRQITGWRALPESDDNRQPRTYGDGEIVYPGRKLGKTLVYECTVEARTMQTVEDTMGAIVQGFGDMSGEGRMDVIPYSGAATWTYHARVIDLQVEPVWDWNENRRTVFEWGFTLSLRMSDPHFYLAGTPYL
jgi:hypothetical protein